MFDFFLSMLTVILLLSGVTLILIATSGEDKNFGAGALILFVFAALALTSMIGYKISLNPKGYSYYGMVDRENNFITLDKDNNPIKVDDPRKAKWFSTKQERDKVLSDFYRLRPVKSTNDFYLED